MAKPFKELTDKMSPESQARARELANKMLEEINWKEYEFKLVFDLPDSEDDPNKYVEALGENCTDALVGVGQKGKIALDFVRKADTDLSAVTSAGADVMRAIPGAKLIEMIPGLNVTMRIIPDICITGTAFDQFLEDEHFLEEAEITAKQKVEEWLKNK